METSDEGLLGKRKTFLTPQTRKAQSPASRLSLSLKDGAKSFLGNFLKDPVKRALLMEVLSQDTESTLKKDDKKELPNKKFKFETPSALCRRRALEKMRAESNASDIVVISQETVSAATNVPFDSILKGVVAYVEIKSGGVDRSAGAKTLMEAMGAEIRDELNRGVTHVVFKDGCFKTFQKARLLKAHLVSVLWVEAVRKSKTRIPEKKYPAIGANVSNNNASLICKQFQEEYADVIEEELNKSRNLSLNNSDDIVDISQEAVAAASSAEENKKPSPLNSLRFDSTPEMTSDTDEDHYKKPKVKRYKKRSQRQSTTLAQIHHPPVTDSTKLGSTQSADMSSLRISTGSNDLSINKTPPQKILDYKNVTVRKKKNTVNILSDVLVSPPRMNNSDTLLKELDTKLEKLNESPQIVNPIRFVASMDYIQNQDGDIGDTENASAVTIPPKTPKPIKSQKSHVTATRKSTRLKSLQTRRKSVDGLLSSTSDTERESEAKQKNSSDDFEKNEVIEEVNSKRSNVKKLRETFTQPPSENARDQSQGSLQHRRSSLDFTPKTPMSQYKSKMTQRGTGRQKKTSIVCTRFHRQEVQVFQQIVKKLGVFFVEDEVSEKTTHVVAAESRRTVNILRAIARGCWVLKSEWLYRSLEAERWLPEEDYELREFSIAVEKARRERQAFGPHFSVDIFANCGKIYVSRASNPRCSDLRELVTLCKGKVTTITRNADVIVGEFVENKTCVTETWLMDSINFYKMKSFRKYLIEAPSSH